MHWWVRLKLYTVCLWKYIANQQRRFIKGILPKLEKWQWLFKKTVIKAEYMIETLTSSRRALFTWYTTGHVHLPHAFAHRQFHWNSRAYNHWSYSCKSQEEWTTHPYPYIINLKLGREKIRLQFWWYDLFLLERHKEYNKPVYLLCFISSHLACYRKATIQ